jgi:Tfp pilus assembly protein PilF
LEKNPNARDVFSSLSFLYQLEDNQTKADQYWQQAKNIDPLLTPK